MASIGGTSSNEGLLGSNVADFMFGAGGNDTLSAFGGNDTLSGGEGNDQIYASTDDDILYGNQGSDRLSAGNGDDFVFDATEVGSGEGAGAWLDSTDPELTEWYTTATQEIDVVDADDVARTLEPGRIQPKGPDRPDHEASGDASLVTRERRPKPAEDDTPQT